MKRAFAGSVFLHAFLFLLFFAPPRPTDVSSFAVEMVTPRPVPSRQMSPNPARSKQPAEKSPVAERAQAPATAAGGGEDGRTPRDVSEAYVSELRERIDRHKAYPRVSVARGEAGTVVIQLTILRDGSLSRVELIEASRFSRLNDAALQAATAAAPFAPLPPLLRLAEWKINLPVRFALGGPL